MTRLISGLLVVLLAGCATVPREARDPTQSQADMDRCYAESKDPAKAEFGPIAKALVYASNIVVVPVTAALTLTLGTMYVYPQTGWEAQQTYYKSCMTKLGYSTP